MNEGNEKLYRSEHLSTMHNDKTAYIYLVPSVS